MRTIRAHVPVQIRYRFACVSEALNILPDTIFARAPIYSWYPFCKQLASLGLVSQSSPRGCRGCDCYLMDADRALLLLMIIL